MSRQIEFDKHANGFGDRYTLFLGNIKSAYQSRILNRSLTYKSIRSFEKEANTIATAYLQAEIEEVQRLEEATKQFIVSDFAASNLDTPVFDNEEYMDYLHDFTKYVYSSIRHQVTKDILYVSQKLRVETLKLMNSGFDYVQLMLNYKEPEFLFNDRAGRNLPSRKYIRALVRDYLIKSYADLFVENAVLLGIDEIEVDHLDANHSDHGIILSVSDEENELNYFKVRDDIFHPNSNAILKVI